MKIAGAPDILECYPFCYLHLQYTKLAGCDYLVSSPIYSHHYPMIISEFVWFPTILCHNGYRNVDYLEPCVHYTCNCNCLHTCSDFNCNLWPASHTVNVLTKHYSTELFLYMVLLQPSFKKSIQVNLPPPT